MQRDRKQNKEIEIRRNRDMNKHGGIEDIYPQTQKGQGGQKCLDRKAKKQTYAERDR